MLVTKVIANRLIADTVVTIPIFAFSVFLLGLPKTLCLRAILSCRNRYSHYIDHGVHVEDDYYFPTLTNYFKIVA